MPPSPAQMSRRWHRINRAVYDRLRCAMQEYDLPPGALVILRCAARNPGSTISDLARDTGMAKSHISRTARQLARGGYIDRRSDAADQRLMRLYVTETAGTQITAMEHSFQSVWAEIQTAMPADHWARLSATLDALLTALELERIESDAKNTENVDGADKRRNKGITP